MLNDISNQLRNTSDTLTDPSEDSFVVSTIAIVFLTVSLSLVLLISAQAIQLKRWIPEYAGNWEMLQDPEEQARKRELHARCLKRRYIPSMFELLPLLILFTVFSFALGSTFTMVLFNPIAIHPMSAAGGIAILYLWRAHRIQMESPLTPYELSRPPFITAFIILFWREEARSSLHEDALDAEIARVGI